MTASYPEDQQTRLKHLNALDCLIRGWALNEGSIERMFPVLIDGETLRRAEYQHAFPHLLMAPAAASDPRQPFTNGNATIADSYLSPAVCYHAYADLAGTELDVGETITARGHCFRNEAADELAPGRRQIEFQMREVVLVGDPDWIEERLTGLKAGVQRLAQEVQLAHEWQAATDPFFLPTSRGKAHAQRLLGTKLELCLPDGLAIASINRHGTFFGERFAIRLSGGDAAHSACVAFGLDRWTAHTQRELTHC